MTSYPILLEVFRGSEEFAYAFNVTGLALGTTYTFTVVATNASGTTVGTVGTFTTAPAA